MKKAFVLLVAALAVAGVVSLRWQPVSFEERAITLQLEQAPPELAAVLEEQPLEIKAVLLDYLNDKMLLLKAQAALIKYPQLAPDILSLYGDRPEFREILAAYGETIVPPIHYFLKNDVASVRLAHYTEQKMHEIKGSAQRLLGSDKKAPKVAADAKAASQPEPEVEKQLTPEQRGWYAVNFIRAEGHDFLGQFVMNSEGKPKWIQSERVFEGASALFTSGIRNIETKLQKDETLTPEDVGFAAVDAFAAMGAVKLLRITRAATASGESISASTRTAALTSRLAQGSRFGMKIVQYGKWPAIAVAAYIAMQHPGIISDVLAELANTLGVPVWLGLFAGWTLILLVALYIGTSIARLLVGPLISVLNFFQRLLAWLEPVEKPKVRRGGRWDNWQVGRIGPGQSMQE